MIKLLQKTDYDLIVCEHKDRIIRVGFNYLKVLLKQTEGDIELVNLATEHTDDLRQDFVSIITSAWCALHSGDIPEFGASAFVPDFMD